MRQSFAKYHKNKKSSPLETLELHIDKMVQGGKGLSKMPDGRICFVEGALPNENCLVQLTQQKKDFAKGKCIKVLSKSPFRVEPRCPLYGRCGGCSLQHLDSKKQAEFLAQVERENFKRIAHVDLPDNFKVHTGEPWHYRNRARIVNCGKVNGEYRYGFREQESNNVVPLEDCPVLTHALNDFLKTTAPKINAQEISLFDNGNGKVSYFYQGMVPDDFKKIAPAVVELNGKSIHSDASVFFQSNLELLPELVAAIQEQCSKFSIEERKWLIDLFSGVGFFATILQDQFERITTVERDKKCQKYADINLSKNSPAKSHTQVIENISAPAEDWLAQNVVSMPATLIVDPPRTGLPPTALTAIVQSSVKRMIYVSCDPVTLARDFLKLSQHGFRMEWAEGFAFYPQTPHLEMVAVLAR
ncbi:MAG: class I SAM-dependent RNA methyltransferase [Fibrobacter sp.]|nr:class I SAM-dependent RNA methyltransferase [Fibrobacter sp.]